MQPTPVDPLRPKYHFSPKANWMNDPNGLVYYQGEYHLFYQHNPHDTVWGPMHWGHAVSRDLLRWEHLPIALAPDEKGTIFSGSAVVDWKDTSGFFGGKSGLVAIFTHHYEDPTTGGTTQSQSLAYSTDRGRTWHKYEHNPVLQDATAKDFRDPKVFWYEPDSKWVMVLAVGDHLRFYSSTNLKDWQYLSSFSAGSREGVWECPDLFPLPIEGTNQRKWVLEVGINPGHIAGGSGGQYFIGEFDGKHFINDNPPETVLWLDYGKDHYAGTSWSDIPKEDGRRLWLGWMSNWQYANHIPTKGWRNAATLPRELTLRKEPEGLRLVQRPVRELESWRQPLYTGTHKVLTPGCNPLQHLTAKAYEIRAEFELDAATEFGFRVRRSGDEFTAIRYDVRGKKLIVDRTHSGIVDFSQDFPNLCSAPLAPIAGVIQLHIFVDSCSVEVFGNEGALSITELIFPAPDSTGMEVYCLGGPVKLLNLEINQLSAD